MTATIASVPTMACREMDAAQALLGVSPSIPPLSSELAADMPSSFELPVLALDGSKEVQQPEKRSLQLSNRFSSSPGKSLEQVPEESPLRSLALGLDALAALASTEQAKIQNDESPFPFLVQSCGFSSSSDDDSKDMPPPPPRRRRRSASNPEGMEKWDSFRNRSSRLHFVLPQSILEEELAEASAAIRERAERSRRNSEEYYDVSPDSVTDAEQATRAVNLKDDSNLTPDELLRRARSRLLEDLSEGTMNGEKGDLILPHSLAKYKEVRFILCMI
jgi:hypothetical protein